VTQSNSASFDMSSDIALTMKPNRTIQKPFSEVLPGQRFWAENWGDIKCHVKLDEPTNNFNACEISTGCLCEVPEHKNCEVRAEIQGAVQPFRFYLSHSEHPIIVAVEGCALFDVSENEIKRRLGEAIKNWNKHDPSNDAVGLFDIHTEIENEFADTSSQVYTDPETLECHIQRQGFVSLSLECYHVAESDWCGNDNLIG